MGERDREREIERDRERWREMEREEGGQSYQEQIRPEAITHT